MKYAVVKIGGKQYKISEGEILDVDKLDVKADENLELKEILLLVNDDEIQIGQPLVADAKATVKVLSQFKGKKIRVSRFKSKVRHRRVIGFRPQLTKIQIEKISHG